MLCAEATRTLPPEVRAVGELVQELGELALRRRRLRFTTSWPCSTAWRSPARIRSPLPVAPAPSTRTLCSAQSGASARTMPAQAVPCPHTSPSSSGTTTGSSSLEPRPPPRWPAASTSGCVAVDAAVDDADVDARAASSRRSPTPASIARATRVGACGRRSSAGRLHGGQRLRGHRAPAAARGAGSLARTPRRRARRDALVAWRVAQVPLDELRPRRAPRPRQARRRRPRRPARRGSPRSGRDGRRAAATSAARLGDRERELRAPARARARVDASRCSGPPPRLLELVERGSERPRASAVASGTGGERRLRLVPRCRRRPPSRAVARAAIVTSAGRQRRRQRGGRAAGGSSPRRFDRLVERAQRRERGSRLQWLGARGRHRARAGGAATRRTAGCGSIPAASSAVSRSATTCAAEGRIRLGARRRARRAAPRAAELLRRLHPRTGAGGKAGEQLAETFFVVSGRHRVTCSLDAAGAPVSSLQPIAQLGQAAGDAAGDRAGRQPQLRRRSSGSSRRGRRSGRGPHGTSGERSPIASCTASASSTQGESPPRRRLPRAELDSAGCSRDAQSGAGRCSTVASAARSRAGAHRRSAACRAARTRGRTRPGRRPPPRSGASRKPWTAIA